MGIKAWKLSASVVLAVRSSISSLGSSKTTDSSSSRVPDVNFMESGNIQILMLRRGEHDKYLPGTHVFPGGNVDISDTNPQWFDLYRANGFDESSFSNISSQGVGSYMQQREQNCLPGWMSLRLCAIRETFEESGILLCRESLTSSNNSPWASFVPVKDLKLWQRRVREDPHQMMTLCETESCVPDVWGLHLWSNWLTPVQQRVRHNAFFFLAMLPSVPEYSLDFLEMDELKWCSAFELLMGLQEGKHRLPNPQLYEISRLSTFHDADKLVTFASNRAQHGCECVMPVQQSAKDGLLFILPGDAAFVQKVDYETPRDMISQPYTLSELREKVLASDGILHRIEVPKSSGRPKVFTHKYLGTCQHAIPISTDNLLQNLVKHKL